MKTIIISGRIKRKLYNTSMSMLFIVTPLIDMRARTARYTAPVHGSSTIATNTPSQNVVNTLPMMDSCFSLIFLAYRGGIPTILVAPGLKYSLSSSIQKAPIMIAIAIYAFTEKLPSC